MNISMHILKTWLEEYDPLSIILEGNMTLKGVRLHSPTSDPDTDYVYIELGYDLFSNDTSNKVLLTNRNDVIQLSTENVEDVFNLVMTAFDHYHQLEFELSLATRLDNPAQRMVDLIQEEFGPAYIMDRRFHLLAISHPEVPGDYLPVWREYENSRMVSLDRLLERTNVDFYKQLNSKVHNRVFRNDMAMPYCNYLMNTWCGQNDRIIGQLMIGFDREILPADKQLCDVLLDYLRTVSDLQEKETGNYLSEIVFDSLISGKKVSPEEIRLVYNRQRWAADDLLFVSAIRFSDQAMQTPYWKNQILEDIKQILSQKVTGVITLMKDDVLFTCSQTSERYITDPFTVIDDLLNKNPLPNDIHVGFSLSFRNFENVHPFYLQALSAARTKRRRASRYCHISECALETCLLSADEALQSASLHPLVPFLAKTDTESQTEYAETLREFLRQERSYLNTSKVLDVHRNTIIYRIDRIQQLFPALDLNDPDEREYLLSSFRIFRRQIHSFTGTDYSES